MSRLFGQSAYNKLMGFSWAVAGVMFIFFPLWFGTEKDRRIGVGGKGNVNVDRDEGVAMSQWIQAMRECTPAQH
ncbi:hypothetical protein [Stenotrophomonas sp. TD3]|uniref:hypothetical protein n=1 Tax=Stenotrophomonas sp. TD3 TaxID=1641707 RepID=UPI0011152B42|nr:hypothetical protein [Stenotrophomonas sp. TD3]